MSESTSRWLADLPRLAGELAGAARELHARGWMQGTSGNASVVVDSTPVRLAITPSGVDKGRLTADDLVVIDDTGRVILGTRRPSEEAPLHLALVLTAKAGAVVHTHSVWGTILSGLGAEHEGLRLEGYEMLKGLSGVRTHEHAEWLPILVNTQDFEALAVKVTAVLARHPASHGVLLSRHGLYTWGRDLAEAKRHTEILEFLLEVTGRMR